MSLPPYELTLPARCTSSVVFSSPHSGRKYTGDFLAWSQLDPAVLRSSEDAWLDRLWSAAPDHGAPLLCAVMPRAYVDLNRSPDELDPSVVEDVRSIAHNPRISSGLGVIPRVVSGGRVIAQGKIARAEAEARIERWWRPYHQTLARLVEEAQRNFGRAIVIDCHSMPREALESHAARGARLPDVVLGDRFGIAADGEIVAAVESLLKAEGLRVARNTPFAGAYITQHYGNPTRGRHALQLEVDRSLYMDERTLTPRPDFEDFRALITRVAAGIADIGRDGARRLAAE